MGFSNMDLDVILFCLEVLQNYYPRGGKHVFVFNMPWIFQPIWRIVKPFLKEDSQNVLTFCNKYDVFNYIDEDQFPAYLGGKSTTPVRTIPTNVLSAKQLSHIGSKAVEELYSVYEKQLEEADTEARMQYCQ